MQKRNPRPLKYFITKKWKNKALQLIFLAIAILKTKLNAFTVNDDVTITILQQHLIKVEIKCNYSWYKLNLTSIFQSIFLAQVADSRMHYSWQLKFLKI